MSSIYFTFVVNVYYNFSALCVLLVYTMPFAVLLCMHQNKLAVWISLRIMAMQSSQTTTTHYSNICWYICIQAKHYSYQVSQITPHLSDFI